MSVFSRVGVACLLIVAAFAAHGGALGGKFHYDDIPAIVENPAIRFWQPVFYPTSPLAVSRGVENSGYRPLTVATFAANYAWGRLDPRGYLLVNLLLHVAVSWMVFVVGRRVLGDDRWASVAALLFAIHPVNAEAVNYVVARSSLLATLGALAALWAFIRRRDGGGAGWLVAGLFAFAAALLSKESAVALIPPLLASSLVLGGMKARGERAAPAPSREALWFVGLAAAFIVVRLAVGGAEDWAGHVAAYPLWAFVELAWRSVLLWVWPWPLGLDHPLRFVDQFDPLLAVTLAVSGIGLVVASIVCWARAPLAVWGAIWVVAGFLPLAPLFWLTTLGLFQENRIAFSAVGLAWVTAAAARAVWVRVESRARAGKIVHSAMLAVCAVLGIVAVVADRWRSEIWRDDRRLWEEVLRYAPENVTAHVNIGSAYIENDELDRSEAVLQEGLRLAPSYAHLHYTLARVFLLREQYEAAHASLLKTISLSPADAKAYGALGLLAQRTGDEAAAEGAYLEALRYNPDSAMARNNLGTIYLKRGEWSLALEQFTLAARRDPTDVDLALNRAVALDALGRRAEARTELESLLTRLPSDERFDRHRRIAAVIVNRVPP